mgnify:CR=1 FL=1
MSLVVESVAKAFGRFPALGGVSLEVKDGEFLALLGPSGSGKTTLLRILAGLEVPDSGTVTLGGENFLALSARDRRIGMVFQHYALFRHMTVAQNIAFGLTVRPRRERPSRAAIASRVNDLLRLIQLEDLGGRYPAQLSGGQRQRVALARALAIEPRMLLLDEPFEGVAPALSMRLSDVISSLRGGDLSVLISQSDLNHSSSLVNQEVVIERGANVVHA